METSHGSTTLTRNADADESSSFSYFQKTVKLQDWWLIKADVDFDGKRLAVPGFTSTTKRASRLFYSAPIIKLHDGCTVETADGIVVILGLFNKSHTKENGFPDEVSIPFLFGFPLCWEEYAKKCFKQAVNSDTDLPNKGELNESIVEPDVTNRIKSAIINFSNPKAAFRNLDESITREESLPVCHSKETLEFSTGNLGVEADVTAPSTTERDLDV